MTEYGVHCMACDHYIEFEIEGVIGDFSDCWCAECVEAGKSPYGEDY